MGGRLEPRTPSDADNPLLRALVEAALKTEQPGAKPLPREALSKSVVRRIWEQFGGHSPDERVDLFREAMNASPESLSALIGEAREALPEGSPERSELQDAALQKWMEALPEQLTRVLSSPLAEMDARGAIRLPLLDSPDSLQGLFSAPSALKCAGDPIGENGHRCADLLQVSPQTEVWLAEAPSHGLPAILHDVRSKGAEAYLALAREFISREHNDRKEEM